MINCNSLFKNWGAPHVIIRKILNQNTIHRCFKVLDSDSGGEQQVIKEAKSIVKLSNMIDNPEVLSRLYDELCIQERAEVALIAAAVLAKYTNRSEVQALLLNGFRKNKNVQKMFGQVPQIRILYSICLSNQLDLLDKLNPNDFSDEFSAEFEASMYSFIESAKKHDISAMSQAVAFLEGLDTFCNPGILMYGANRFIEHSTFFAKLAGIEK